MDTEFMWAPNVYLQFKKKTWFTCYYKEISTNLNPKYHEALLICSFENRHTFRKTVKQYCNHIYNLSIVQPFQKLDANMLWQCIQNQRRNSAST
jgi:hypothetical protein